MVFGHRQQKASTMSTAAVEISRWSVCQYQFKVPFILYAEFESISKLFYEQYREKMNQMKTERKGNTTLTEKIDRHVTSAGLDKFISMRPIFRTRKRNGRLKPKYTLDRETTTNNDLCSLSSK